MRWEERGRQAFSGSVCVGYWSSFNSSLFSLSLSLSPSLSLSLFPFFLTPYLLHIFPICVTQWPLIVVDMHPFLSRRVANTVKHCPEPVWWLISCPLDLVCSVSLLTRVVSSPLNEAKAAINKGVNVDVWIQNGHTHTHTHSNIVLVYM